MKRLAFLLALALPLSGLAAAPAAQFSGNDPAIVRIVGRRVQVAVPEGLDRVTLQSLIAPPKGRVNLGAAVQPAWKTVGMEFPHGRGGKVQFKLSRLISRRNLRVFGNKADVLSGDLLTGVTTFLADPAEPVGNQTGATGGTLSLNGSGSVLKTDSATGLTSSVLASSAAATTAPRDVVESDIWKLEGDRLFFFNQNRGLQVFDVSTPDDPALLGTLRMPSVGDDMYVLDQNHAVLLKKSNDWSWVGWGGPIFLGGGVSLNSDAVSLNATSGTMLTATSAASLSLTASRSLVSSARLIQLPIQRASHTSEVVVTDTTGGQPLILARLPFDGSLRESRMVGRVLYIASDVYHQDPDTTVAEWGMQLTSFDLSDPANPVQRATLHLGGWANAVMATDRFFLAAKWSGNGNVVDLIDISDPAGAMTQAGQVSVDGNVADKFKMHLEGEVLTVVSQAWVQNGTAPNTGWWNWNSTPVTKVSTFSLADAAHPAALGNLEVASGENLYATRFDGDRLYVVTATRVLYPNDPLWIVDLSKPGTPSILGHLDIPGFSTYVAPLGDRLVSIGLVDWQPAVSLFDVSDPTAPALLSRISLATKNGWSYTEATWSEKAFSVLPDDNLILIPLSGYDSASGESNGVQIVDLFADKLVKRGLIPASIVPRRATTHRDRILSISSQHLVSVDASNRDKPVVKADLEIAWIVDRVVAIGNYLVQIGRDGWERNGGTTLTVSPANDPNQSLTTLDLPCQSVIGTAVRGGVLHVLQNRDTNGLVSTGLVDASAIRPSLILSTFDVAHLPALTLLARIIVPLPDGCLSSGVEARPLWPTPTTLVWAQEFYRDSLWKPIWRLSPVSQDAEASTAAPAGYWSTQWLHVWSQRLFAFDVTRPEAPRSGSILEIGGHEPWQVSAPLAGEGVIYVSHKELGKGLRPAGEYRWEPRSTNADSSKDEPTDARRNRHFLQIVEYGDAALPFIRPAQVNLPGRLVGLAQSGQLLLTLGQGYSPVDGTPIPAVTAFHTSAFDGTAADLLDVLPIANVDQPFEFADGTLFVLKPEPAQIWKPFIDEGVSYFWNCIPGEANPNQSVLRSFAVSSAGKFAPLGEVTLDHETSLHLFGSLAVAQGGSRSIRLIDGSTPAALRDLGTFQFEGWVWPNLDAADGSLDRGLWIPLGASGVEAVPLSTK